MDIVYPLIWIIIFWLILKSLFKKTRIKRPDIPPKTRTNVFRRDNYKCVHCGKGPPNVELECDHIQPWSWYKSKNVMNNPKHYQTLCFECNRGKGNRFEG